MKKLLSILVLTALTSCSNWVKEEAKASAKAGAASGRINASEGNTKDVLKELDQ